MLQFGTLYNTEPSHNFTSTECVPTYTAGNGTDTFSTRHLNPSQFHYHNVLMVHSDYVSEVSMSKVCNSTHEDEYIQFDSSICQNDKIRH